MINFILITLITKSLLDLILKNDPRISLQCGIWGYFGKSSRNLDWNKFNILGIFNDKRGGDASGIVYGDNYSHENKSMKLFTNHISELKLPKKDDTHWAFGHTRKASFGQNQEQYYTQPLIKFNGEEIENVFCHNGTLYNHDDLIEVFNLENTFDYPEEDGSFKSHKSNDSWVLFSAMISGKFDILSKYKGGTAFSYYDKISDKLYLWSGASKHSENSTVVSEERPIFISEYANHIWFSSDKQPLEIIDIDGKARIFKASPNVLYIYQKGKLLSKDKVFDRSNCVQSEYKSSSNYSNKDYWNDYGYGSGYNYKNYGYSENDSYYKDNYKKKNKQLSLPMPSFGTNLIDTESFISTSDDFTPKFIRGRYWYKGSLLNGIKHINSFGEVYDKPVKSGREFEFTETYYFYNGIFIIDHDAYNEVCRIFNISNRFSNAFSKDIKDISKYSAYPVNVFGKDECWYHEAGVSDLFSGDFRPMFSRNRYVFSYGECLEIKDSRLGIAFLEDGFDINVEYEDDGIKDDYAMQYSSTCQECKGTGLSKIGMNCDECKGSGLVSLNVDIDTKDDGFNDQEELMISKEIDEELSGVLQSVEAAKSIIQYHQGSSSKADRVVTMLDDISSKLELASIPF